jgi:translation initiation factor 2 beta subunit (eIF-2beta)/eIF-5
MTSRLSVKISISSKVSKIPKIDTSSSSKKHELVTLHISKKSNHTVIESCEDSDNSKSTTSYKMSSWGSSDLSSGVDNLFKAIGLMILGH